MSQAEDRQRDVGKIMTGVSELREEVAIHAAPIGFWRGLLSLFLVLRLGFAYVTVVFPEGGVLTDSRGYLALAHRFAEDGQYGVQESGEADMLRPPGYVAFLAGMELVFGTDLYWVTLVQLLFSGLTSLILLRLGIELQRPRAGLLAAWLYALSPNVLLWSLTIMTEVSFALLFALTTLLVVRSVNAYRRWWPAAAGVMLAAMAYFRPIALVLVPVWAGIVYWFRRPRYGTRRALTSALLPVVLVIAAVLPWAYRNWVEYDNFTFSTATQKTWIGFNLAEVVAQAEGIDRNRAVASLDADRGLVDLTLDVVAVYPVAFVKAQTIGVIRTLVGSDVGTWGNVLGDDTWLGLGLLSGAFWGGLDNALGQLIRGEDPTAGVRILITTICLGYSLLLMLPAVFGLLFARLDNDAGRLFRAIAIWSVLLLILLPGAAGQARFRVPAEPHLAMLAGLGVSYVVDGALLWWRRRRIRRAQQF